MFRLCSHSRFLFLQQVPGRKKVPAAAMPSLAAVKQVVTGFSDSFNRHDPHASAHCSTRRAILQICVAPATTGAKILNRTTRRSTPVL